MKKRSVIIVAIVLMSIGFAAVSTTLVINGNAKVSENQDDFSVIFTAASLDGMDVYSTVVNDTKQIINFSTSELKALNQTSVLTYEVTNNSSNYDAEVSVTCVSKDGTTAKYTSIKNKLENDATVVKVKESLNGTLTITLDQVTTESITEEYTCKLEFNAVEIEKKLYDGPTEWVYEYTGSEQTITIPISGTYKLEAWGAQGGNSGFGCIGGYGGYSEGEIRLNQSQTIYVNIGGQGTGNGTHVKREGGYNGGGTATPDNDSNTRQSSGGGATHISLSSGLLSTLETSKDNILIVAGGGGGSAANYYLGCTTAGSGGGIIGGTGTTYHNSNTGSWGYGSGGTQTSGGTGDGPSTPVSGSFGQGASSVYAGGGGGLYGGGVYGISSGGGSGYISNQKLFNKVMYCYNCTESIEEATKTINTTCTNEEPTENCAKQGNGYVRITLIK